MRELCCVVVSTKMRELCQVVISTKMRELCRMVVSAKMRELCCVVVSTKMRELRRVLVFSGQTLWPCSPLLGTLPRPSISAEPGSVVPWGRPVSIVCRGPAGVMSFRLEKGNRKDYKDVGVTFRGEQVTEARFHITALREDAVGRYHCIYRKESTWSALSEALSLEGTAEAVSALPAGVPGPRCALCPLAPIPAPRALCFCLLCPRLPCLHTWLSSLSLVSPGKSQGPGDP